MALQAVKTSEGRLTDNTGVPASVGHPADRPLQWSERRLGAILNHDALPLKRAAANREAGRLAPADAPDHLWRDGGPSDYDGG